MRVMQIHGHKIPVPEAFEQALIQHASANYLLGKMPKQGKTPKAVYEANETERSKTAQKADKQVIAALEEFTRVLLEQYIPDLVPVRTIDQTRIEADLDEAEPDETGARRVGYSLRQGEALKETYTSSRGRWHAGPAYVEISQHPDGNVTVYVK
jgi:hypothetical protein